MIYHLKSKDNRHIVEAAKLKQAKYRQQEKLFLIEGFHLLEMAVQAKVVEKVFALKEIENLAVDQYLVSEEILKKLASSQNPQGVVAVCRIQEEKNLSCEHILYLDAISDPGNLGTILRTALAFGYFDVILSPNSVSAIFCLNILNGDLTTLADLKTKGYQIIATALKKSVPLDVVNVQKKHVVVLGNEARGISEEVLSLADCAVRIEISGIDSLNVAVAGGIVLYELTRKSR
jgi:TrmH family RNA methyltransferase